MKKEPLAIVAFDNRASARGPGVGHDRGGVFLRCPRRRSDESATRARGTLDGRRSTTLRRGERRAQDAVEGGVDCPPSALVGVEARDAHWSATLFRRHGRHRCPASAEKPRRERSRFGSHPARVSPAPKMGERLHDLSLTMPVTPLPRTRLAHLRASLALRTCSHMRLRARAGPRCSVPCRPRGGGTLRRR